MELLYVGIIIAVIVVTVVIAVVAFTGGGEGFNPITVDNMDKLFRPSSSGATGAP